MTKLLPCLAALLLAFHSSLALSELRQAHTVQDSELRAEPNHNAASLGRIGKQNAVLVQARQGGWYQVRTASGQEGWLPLLSLRLAKEGGTASSGSNLGSLLSLGSQAAPASGVATGVRGISDEQLSSGSSGLPADLQYLERFAAQPGEARAFAQQGGLQSQALPYAR